MPTKDLPGEYSIIPGQYTLWMIVPVSPWSGAGSRLFVEDVSPQIVGAQDGEAAEACAGRARGLNYMYISTSYHRVLVQELRVFRPQNAPNSVPWNTVTPDTSIHAGVGRNSALAGSSHCTESRGGTRRHVRMEEAIRLFLTRLTHPRKRGGPEAGRTGIPCEFA